MAKPCRAQWANAQQAISAAQVTCDRRSLCSALGVGGDHQSGVHIEERPRYAPGRPKKNVPRVPVAIDYVLRTEIIEKREAIDKRRQLAGCFVLISIR